MKILYIDFGNTNIKLQLNNIDYCYSSNDSNFVIEFISTLEFDKIIICDSIHQNFLEFKNILTTKYHLILARDLIINSSYHELFNKGQVKHLGTDIMLGIISKIGQLDTFTVLDSGTASTLAVVKKNKIKQINLFRGSHMDKRGLRKLFKSNSFPITMATKWAMKPIKTTYVEFISNLEKKYCPLFLTGQYFKEKENLVIVGMKKL